MMLRCRYKLLWFCVHVLTSPQAVYVKVADMRYMVPDKMIGRQA